MSEEIETTKKGGKQHLLEARFDLIDAKALKLVSKILSEGAGKYGEDNWRKIDIESHVNHAIHHLYMYLCADKHEDHLANACCRTLFALAKRLRPTYLGKQGVKRTEGYNKIRHKKNMLKKYLKFKTSRSFKAPTESIRLVCVGGGGGGRKKST